MHLICCSHLPILLKIFLYMALVMVTHIVLYRAQGGIIIPDHLMARWTIVLANYMKSDVSLLGKSI